MCLAATVSCSADASVFPALCIWDTSVSAAAFTAVAPCTRPSKALSSRLSLAFWASMICAARTNAYASDYTDDNENPEHNLRSPSSLGAACDYSRISTVGLPFSSGEGTASNIILMQQLECTCTDWLQLGAARKPAAQSPAAGWMPWQRRAPHEAPARCAPAPPAHCICDRDPQRIMAGPAVC